jgi:PKD repeat protein
MNKILHVTFSLLLPTLCMAQGEANQWCFGFNAGLDFNSGSPVATSSQVNTTEGSSSIADAAGNLLFYSDGITVWNKNHAVMPNGNGLNGGGSSTQSALIVAQPQTPDIYYIFTTAEAQGTQGFCYSIVDMSLQGGLGDVTTKNVQLFTPSAEKVCATKHTNGIDVWVMGHELGSSNFIAYLLTSAGLSAPVISSCGTNYTTVSGAEIGYMKFSPDGKQVAHAIRYLFTFELDSFNTSTGVVSAPIVIPSTNGTVSYGVEFSPDGHLLYTADSQTSQYDVSIHDAVSIMASKTFISGSVWALQLGPDHKIYLAEYTQSALSVINDPDVAGTGCNFASLAIPLIGTSSLGLPNIMISFTPGPPVAIFSAPNHICPGTCTNFTNLSVNGTSFQWTFPGANPSVSVDINPTQICYNTPGQYNVSLIASNAGGSDTLMLPNFITVYPYPAPQGISQSGDTLFANQGAVSYQWYFSGNIIPGATDYFYVASQSGNYNVVATDANDCEVEAVIFDVVAGIQSALTGNQFIVYPDPATDFIVVNPAMNDSYVHVLNVLGEEVLSHLYQNTIDVSQLPSGVYWLEVIHHNKLYRTRFIKSAAY